MCSTATFGPEKSVTSFRVEEALTSRFASQTDFPKKSLCDGKFVSGDSKRGRGPQVSAASLFRETQKGAKDPRVSLLQGIQLEVFRVKVPGQDTVVRPSRKQKGLQSGEKPAELKHLTPAEEKKANAISLVTASESESMTGYDEGPTIEKDRLLRTLAESC